MTDIKTREHSRDINVLDKSINYGEQMKNAFLRSKNQAKNLADDGEVSPSEYAEDQIQYVVEDAVSEVGNEIQYQVDTRIEHGKNNAYARRQEVRVEKKARKVENALKRYDPEFETSAYSTQRYAYTRGREHAVKKAEKPKHYIKTVAKFVKDVSAKGTKAVIKIAKKRVKTAQTTSKMKIKTVEATVKAAEKTTQVSAKTTKVSAKVAETATKFAKATTKVLSKVAVTTGKAMLSGLKSLAFQLILGIWSTIVTVVVFCVVALVAGGCFGIFFSGEDTGSNQTMSAVVREINDEYMKELDEIKKNNPYDELEMSGTKAIWPEVLSVYAVKVTTDSDNEQEVATITEEKKEILKAIFWEMNQINYSTSTRIVTTIIESDDGNGNILEEEVEKNITILGIEVRHKTAEQMAQKYRFNKSQKEQLETLLDSENNSLWTDVLYGVYAVDGQIVEVAYSQLGNVGGEPYWSWYGFGSRVEWCACFVSWCANECGYIEMGAIPKFALCSIGAQWFKDRGQWGDNSMEPVAGTIIFFDWDGDRNPDHVGIVEYIEDGVVYTIEGNSGDTCRQKQYEVGNNQIYGYGLPAY